MTVPTTTVPLDLAAQLDALQPPCDWRIGHDDARATPAEWIITILINERSEITYTFCTPHRDESAEVTTGMPVRVIDAQPIRVQR